YLGREDAPFGKKVWEALDKTMLELARMKLSGRKILPLKGPLGIGITSVSLSTKVFQDAIKMESIPLFFQD
ncbi:MAG: encapsulin, partial [Candidatus Caldatribacteriaceae bacterium]